MFEFIFQQLKLTPLFQTCGRTLRKISISRKSTRLKLVDEFLGQIYNERATDLQFIERQINTFNQRVLVLEDEKNLHGRRFFLESLFGGKLNFLKTDRSTVDFKNIDLIVALGYSSLIDNIHLISGIKNIPILFLEAAFLRSILMDKSDSKFDRAICFFVDDLGHHYDPSHSSRIEFQLNQTNFLLTQEQLFRAKELIRRIVDRKLTKYNDQPIFDLKVGRPSRKKILVIEQARNDWAILKSGGGINTFEAMLDKAIADNPDADILVKIHPDTIDGKRGGLKKSYYGDSRSSNNIYKIDEKINPYSLLEQCSKVYVFSSMFGFEALMAGKEVHVFGLPCYAGWGLTIDYQKCERRDQCRTIEDLVYVIYCKYTIYIDPNGRRCEPEHAIDYLLALRDKFTFNQFNIE